MSTEEASCKQGLLLFISFFYLFRRSHSLFHLILHMQSPRCSILHSLPHLFHYRHSPEVSNLEKHNFEVRKSHFGAHIFTIFTPSFFGFRIFNGLCIGSSTSHQDGRIVQRVTQQLSPASLETRLATPQTRWKTTRSQCSAYCT